MRLTVLASGSAGNGYLFEARHSALLVECGVRPEVMMRRTAVPFSRIAGALVTHEHKDHAGYADRYAALGLRIYASEGTIKAINGIVPEYQSVFARWSVLRPLEVRYIDEWKVMPFDTRHDAADPLGFIIEHPEAGRILFLTDTEYCPYDFRHLGLDHILVEANYDDAILDGNVANGLVDAARAARTRGTHMSLRSACDLIRADQTAELKNVILIHLSYQNSDRETFARRAAETALFARISIAKAGLSIDLNKFEI